MSARTKWFNKITNGPRQFVSYPVLLRGGGHQHGIYRPKDDKDSFFFNGARIAKPK